MQGLATASSQIGLSSRPFAFAASAAEVGQKSQDWDGGFVLWADTENVLTSARPLHGLAAGVVRLDTAFTVLKQTRGDHEQPARHLIQDECEALAWQLLQRMERDVEPGKATCGTVPISMVDFESIVIERDGPYFSEHYGVTVRLSLDIINSIPKYNAELWQ